MTKCTEASNAPRDDDDAPPSLATVSMATTASGKQQQQQQQQHPVGSAGQQPQQQHSTDEHSASNLSSSSSSSSSETTSITASQFQTHGHSSYSSSSSSSLSSTSPSSTTTGSFAPGGSEAPTMTSSFVTSSSDDAAIGQSNLIVNYLPAFMSQDDVRALFESMGQLESCKLVRDKNTGHSLGYGFVKFKSKEAAKNAMKAFNGLRIQNKTIKVSYARPSSDVIKGANLYISGLPPEVTPRGLTDLFGKYGSIISVRILSDSQTGLSKGVAFIRFDLRSEAEAAVSDLNGKVIFGAPITVKFASQPAVSLDARSGQSQTNGGHASKSFLHHPYMNSSRHNNNNHNNKSQAATGSEVGDQTWTLHVHNLPSTTSDSDVWSLFGPMGTVRSVKVTRDKVTGLCKGHALVSMPDLEQARSAVDLLNGLKVIRGNVLQVQLKGARGKQCAEPLHQTPSLTAQDSSQQQQQHQQLQHQQLFLQQQQQQLAFSGAGALQQVQHYPVVFQQSTTTDSSSGHHQQQQQQQQQQISLQQSFQLPTQIALHPSAGQAIQGTLLAHSTFYPAVIDSTNLISGLGAAGAPEFPGPLSFISGAAVLPQTAQFGKLNIPLNGPRTPQATYAQATVGTIPLAILHDI